MTRSAQDIIDDMRNIVKPRIGKMLLEANFEGCGKEDKAEFETEFEMILTLAEKALEQDTVPFDFELYEAGLMNMPKVVIEVLGKIRDEVCDINDEIVLNPDSFYERKAYVRFSEVINIIDKYRKESEAAE